MTWRSSSSRRSERTCRPGSLAKYVPRKKPPQAPRRFDLKRDRERDAMRRALEIAWRGWGRVSPNPLVGAVVLRGDDAVAEGWHAEFGGPHAELAALHAAGDKARGATLVVTLEPCAHHGKTPPCTDAIRAAGVRRVVAAVRDPDLDARGGFDILKRAGIETQFGVLAEEAAAQNAPFLFTRQQTDLPFVALKLATSIDGRIADAGGRSQWISGPEARDHVHWLRAGFDAIAVGGALGTKLLAEGLVDRLYWVQSPVWLGEGAVPAFPGIPAFPLAEAPRWTVVERRALGFDTLLVLDRRLCLPES